MQDVAAVWSEVLPNVRNAVTGVGVWTALNTCKPIAIEDDVFVVGLPGQMTELAGHLRMPQTRKIIEAEMGKRLGLAIELRVIEGTGDEDWERTKRRDAEARRLQEAALNRARAEASSRTNWDSVFETLSRSFAAIPNKSVPQNRAKFYAEALALLARSRKESVMDELGERNFGRCVERVSQYSEVPTTLVALEVLRQCGEL